MKNKFKKLLSVVLSICLILSVCSVAGVMTVSAEEKVTDYYVLRLHRRRFVVG